MFNTKSKTKALMVSLLILGSAGASYAATGTYLEPVIGQPYVTLADARDVVHDETTGTIARSSSGACIRTTWMNGYDECQTEAAAAPLPKRVEMHQAAALSREERTVYFGFNQASLSPEMKQRLDSLATVLRSDNQVKGARIVGYADRIGNPGYNEKLSKKRAENVRQYMIAKGMINTTVADTRWLGSTTPSTDCGGNLKRPQLIDCLQTDRRVEVEIDFTPDVQATR